MNRTMPFDMPFDMAANGVGGGCAEPAERRGLVPAKSDLVRLSFKDANFRIRWGIQHQRIYQYIYIYLYMFSFVFICW